MPKTAPNTLKQPLMTLQACAPMVTISHYAAE